MARELINAALPSYACPPGTKMHILDLGTLNVDEGWLLLGKNGGSSSVSNPTNKRRDLMIIAGLIEHPEAGLILFETGCAKDVTKSWADDSLDLFPRTKYENKNHLDQAIKDTGNDIKDVAAVIIGHLHLDHAGGLENFRNTGVPIYVHEEEFKHACWAAATNNLDTGLYLSNYLCLDKTINWEIFNDSQFDFCTGITLHHCPGHTPGLCIMQVNLLKDGTFIWTTDQYHIRENYEKNHAHGWLLRDSRSWIKSGNFIRRLQKLYSASLIFGHDHETATRLIQAKSFYE